MFTSACQPNTAFAQQIHPQSPGVAFAATTGFPFFSPTARPDRDSPVFMAAANSPLQSPQVFSQAQMPLAINTASSPTAEYGLYYYQHPLAAAAASPYGSNR